MWGGTHYRGSAKKAGRGGEAPEREHEEGTWREHMGERMLVAPTSHHCYGAELS